MTEQFEAWNGREGRHWVRQADRYDAMLQRFTPHLLDAAALADGAQVLDVGCGSGQTTRMAARVADGALGVDISAPLIEEARRRAKAENVRNARFETGDAQGHPLPVGGADVAISRFGVMFFADPAAAFSNIARAVRVGGRVAFLCWQEPLRNEWIVALGASIAARLGMPEIGGDGPGPFSLADPDRMKELLTGAGLSGVTIDPVSEPLRLGSDPDDVVAYAQDLGLINDLLADADEATRTAVFNDIRSAMTQFHRAEGVWIGAAAWLVTAHRPA